MGLLLAKKGIKAQTKTNQQTSQQMDIMPMTTYNLTFHWKFDYVPSIKMYFYELKRVYVERLCINYM